MSLFEQDVPKLRLVLEIEGVDIHAIITGVRRVVQNIEHGEREGVATMGLHGPILSYDYQVFDFTGEGDD